MAKGNSSNRWLNEHFSDAYVKKAQEMGLRSRAVFKLEEIDQKDHLVKPGHLVLDLGAAPGGWSEYALKRVGRTGQVIALDLLEMDPIPGVHFIQGDFSEDSTYKALSQVIGDKPVNLVLSDIAPNMSGSKAVDQPRAMYLAELVLECAKETLSPDGAMLIKLFQGEGFDAYVRDVKSVFKSVAIRKPKASRPRSREVYLLARGFKL